MADALDRGKEIRHRSEADAALSETASGHDFRMQFVVLAEEQMFSRANLSSGPHQTFPLVGFARNLPGQKDFDSAPQKISCGWIRRTHRLGLHAASPAIQARGEDARIVEYDQVVRPQQAGKVPELCIAHLFRAAIQMQQAR